MSYTAKELFTSWYSKNIGRDASGEEINLRRNSISEMLKSDDPTIWLQTLCTYLGIVKIGDREYEDTVTLAKGEDENFILQDSNLVRVIAGCAIAEKIESNDSWVADFLALALELSLATKAFDPPVEEIFQHAGQFIIDQVEDKRKIEKLEVSVAIKPATVKVEIPQLSDENKVNFSNSVTKVVTSLLKDLTALTSDLNNAKEQLKAASENFSALAEETNILWWLFRSYSNIIEAPFRECSAELLAVSIAIELAELTISLPTIGAPKSIISKALSNSAYETDSLLSYKAIIEAALSNQHPKLKAKIPNCSDLVQLTPLVIAIKYRLEYGGTEWEAVYAKHCNISLLNVNLVRMHL